MILGFADISVLYQVCWMVLVTRARKVATLIVEVNGIFG